MSQQNYKKQLYTRWGCGASQLFPHIRATELFHWRRNTG